MNHQTEIFNAFETQLKTGANLIEASAGTGKTFAIAMLVVRLLVEKNISIAEIIVTTFTKAATAELKERIRSRIQEALLLAKNKPELVEDQLLKDWFYRLDGALQNQAREGLTLALLEIDHAAVFTIHGFCQRMLVEFALETNQLFNLELTENINNLFEQVAEDFWRKEVYGADEFTIRTLVKEYKTPAELLKSVEKGYTALKIYPEKYDIPTYNADEVTQSYSDAVSCLDGFSDIFNTENKAFFKKESWQIYQQIQPEPFLLYDHSDLFTEAGVIASLNGQKFRDTKKQSSDEKIQVFLLKYGITFAPFEKFDQIIQASKQSILVGMRYRLLEVLKAEVPIRLQNQQMTSFDGLIQALSKAMKENNLQLITALQQRYKVALIDEFQDTDKDQWDIFAKVFNADSHYLYLIGDPKQAIYKFRGADIFTYLSVAKQVDQKYTLAYNWRSHPGIVNGVNALFQSMDKPFVINDFPFDPVVAAKSDKDGVIVDRSGKSIHPMQLATVTVKSEMAQCMAEQIVQLLSGEYFLKKTKDNETRLIQASDIAILVSSHKNAEVYQQALWQVNVPVTISRTASVFRSIDAEQWLKVLYSVCYPNNLVHLKAMLSTDYFGLNAISYYEQYLQSEDKLDALIERFSHYHQIWLEKGFMPMVTELLSVEMNEQLLKLPRFERRLTDLLHVSELMQQAIATERFGMFKALEWFQQQIANASDNLNSAEEQKIRLESEQKTVTIMTMHASKGLEFPIVFCPNLAESSSLRAKDMIIFNEPDIGQAVDIGSAQFDAHQQQLIREDLSEKMRLFYVAITRAKYRCYLIWPQQEKSKALSFENHSPLSYLMGLSNINDTQRVQSQYINLVEQYPDIFSMSDWQIVNVTHHPALEETTTTQLSPLLLEKTINQTWQMTSYTALSRLADDSTQQDIAYIKAEDEIDPLPEEVIHSDADSDQLYAELPKGAATGNLIHEILEKFSFKTLVNEVYSEYIEQEIKRYCVKFSLPENIIPTVKLLLKNTLSLPLDLLGKSSLSELSDKNTLKEMPFYLSLSAMNTQQINVLLAKETTFQPIGYKQVEGLMNGFIDLIFVKDGKYYLADYKSNTLDKYDQLSLTEAMHHHNYGLQLWIYSVVLHRFLQNTLPDYQFEQHFGGVFYFFVRGMIPNQDENGVFYKKPDIQTLTRLSSLLSDKETSHEY